MSKDKRIRNLSGLSQILLDLKPYRCDSDVYINQDVDVTELVKYIEKYKENGDKITYFHAFVTALAKTMYNREKLNYYVRNRHLYEHNQIVISFVAKVSFDDKSEEVMILIPINEKDNIFTIKDKITFELEKYRNKSNTVKKVGANNAIDLLGKLPNIIRIPIVGIFKELDKLAMLPSSLIKDNLYYSSIIVSNLGSIKCDAIYHNLTNFGTCSSLMTIGEIKEKEIINVNGKKEIIKYCEFGVNIDERIADGYYFAKSLKLFEYIINNPKMLEEDCNKKIEVKENH